VTSSVLVVSENGTGVPAIIGDAIGGRVRRLWRVPIRIDSDLVIESQAVVTTQRVVVSTSNVVETVIAMCASRDTLSRSRSVGQLKRK